MEQFIFAIQQDFANGFISEVEMMRSIIETKQRKWCKDNHKDVAPASILTQEERAFIIEDGISSGD